MTKGTKVVLGALVAGGLIVAGFALFGRSQQDIVFYIPFDELTGEPHCHSGYQGVSLLNDGYTCALTPCGGGSTQFVDLPSGLGNPAANVGCDGLTGSAASNCIIDNCVGNGTPVVSPLTEAEQDKFESELERQRVRYIRNR